MHLEVEFEIPVTLKLKLEFNMMINHQEISYEWMDSFGLGKPSV
jgi:hypothetical protein